MSNTRATLITEMGLTPQKTANKVSPPREGDLGHEEVEKHFQHDESLYVEFCIHPEDPRFGGNRRRN